MPSYYIHLYVCLILFYFMFLSIIAGLKIIISCGTVYCTGQKKVTIVALKKQDRLFSIFLFFIFIFRKAVMSKSGTITFTTWWPLNIHLICYLNLKHKNCLVIVLWVHRLLTLNLQYSSAKIKDQVEFAIFMRLVIP